MSQLLFQDETGQQVKFFIQRDVPEYAALCEEITALGGRVEEKIPRSGFLLIIPGSEEAHRLRECWDKPNERPDRFFVPFTYVQACRAEGRLLRQIFLVAHRPLKFFIHPGIANVNTRDVIRSQILHSGGDPNASELETDVIIADHGNPEVFNHLIKVNNGFKNHVESFQWVKKCIDQGELAFTPLVYKNPGGRRPGEERTPFTPEDDEYLCQWIAEKIPYKNTGGRTGNKLYQQLVDKVDEPGYGWVKRHTWQSWRERYKKNTQDMDPKIARIVDERKPALGEIGQYGYVRKAEPGVRKRSSGKRKASTPLDGEGATDAQRLAAALAGHIPLPPGMPPPFPPDHFPGGQLPPPPFGFPPQMPPPPEGMPGMGGGPMDHMPPPPPPPPQPDFQPASQSESQPESQPEAGPSGEGETQWPIREGSGPQPNWAKRKASGDPEDEGDAKRQRIEQEGDPVILEISSEYRFTVTEVQEYFEKSKDLEKTRKRFKKMRESLDRLEDDD